MTTATKTNSLRSVTITDDSQTIDNPTRPIDQLRKNASLKSVAEAQVAAADRAWFNVRVWSHRVNTNWCSENIAGKDRALRLACDLGTMAKHLARLAGVDADHIA